MCASELEVKGLLMAGSVPEPRYVFPQRLKGAAGGNRVQNLSYRDRARLGVEQVERCRVGQRRIGTIHPAHCSLFVNEDFDRHPRHDAYAVYSFAGRLINISGVKNDRSFFELLHIPSNW